KGEKGTGLGLAMVFALAERLGGEVRVDSAEGRGTVLSLRLPLVVAPVPEALATPVPKVTRPVNKLRILAVGDQPALSKAVRRLLLPHGHVVTTATSGEEALRLLTDGAFDLVLSDVGMGAGMNGWELAERVRTGWPDVRFMLATGWGAGIDPAEAREKGVEAVL